MKALVTGASRGIGRALVRELVASGYQVWGVARSGGVLQALAEELGTGFHYTVADLTTSTGIQAVINDLTTAAFYPKKIYLVAGAYSTADATFSTPEHREWMLACNYTAPVALYEALLALPTTPTHVVVLSSVFALLSDDLNPAYAEAKAQLGNYFIQENAKHGVATKVVYLGPVNTAINQHAKRHKSMMAIEPEQVARYLKQLPKSNHITFFYPFSAYVFYQIFRYLPKNIYASFMNQVRR